MSDHARQMFDEPYQVHPDIDTPINDLDTEPLNYEEKPF